MLFFQECEVTEKWKWTKDTWTDEIDVEKGIAFEIFAADQGMMGHVSNVMWWGYVDVSICERVGSVATQASELRHHGTGAGVGPEIVGARGDKVVASFIGRGLCGPTQFWRFPVCRLSWLAGGG